MAGWKYHLVRAAAAFGASRRKGLSGKAALIIPPAGPGSVGDAAMITSIIAALRARGFDRVDLLEIEKGQRWGIDAPEDALVPAEKFIAYGSRLNLASLLAGLGRYSDLLCIGADILDGIYDEVRMANRIELLHHAAVMGLRVTIVGSSFSRQPSALCVERLRALPSSIAIFARDVDSHARMVQALERPIGLSADVVFLLPSAPERLEGHAAADWAARQRAEDRPIVALNANNLHEAHHPTLAADYTLLAAAIIRGGGSVLLVPHDVRTERSDRVIAAEIAAGVGADMAPHIHAFHAETPGQLKALLAGVDLIVTGRMHAAIIALGAHTPALSFAYANKFEGLYRHLELDPAEMILSLEHLHADPEAVAARIEAVRQRAPALRAHIAARLDPIRTAAERNFAPIDGVAISDIAAGEPLAPPEGKAVGRGARKEATIMAKQEG